MRYLLIGFAIGFAILLLLAAYSKWLSRHKHRFTDWEYHPPFGMTSGYQVRQCRTCGWTESRLT